MRKELTDQGGKRGTISALENSRRKAMSRKSWIAASAAALVLGILLATLNVHPVSTVLGVALAVLALYVLIIPSEDFRNAGMDIFEGVGLDDAAYEDTSPCFECGAAMMRDGACYKCLNCGAKACYS